MTCPACRDRTLTKTERAGVEIDYCPNCRGVWLDRGALDAILDRAGLNAPATPPTPHPHPHHYPPKRESWLGEILDFD